MCLLNTFCCCCELRVGVIVVSVLNLIFRAIGITLAAINYDVTGDVILSVYIVGFVLLLLAAIFMIVGAAQENENLVLVAVVMQGLELIVLFITTVWTFYLGIYMAIIALNITLILIFIFLFVVAPVIVFSFGLYFWIVSWSYHKDLFIQRNFC